MTPARTLLPLIVGAALALLPAPAFGAVIQVAEGADDVVADDGMCTPREAVTAANQDARSGPSAGECAAGRGRDVIRLPEGPFNFARAGAREDANATGDLDLASDIELRGAGAGRTRFDARGLDRALEVRPGATVVISGITVVGGQAPHGGTGLRVDGAPGAPAGGTGAGGPGGAGEHGGAILNGGTLTLADSVVRDNRAGDGGAGGIGRGGLGNAAGAVGGIGSGGAGGAGGSGGAIYNAGTLTVVRATLAANQAGYGGAGGEGRGGNGHVPAAGNVAGGHGGTGAGGSGGAGGAGGAIAGPGALRITRSLIVDNRAGGGGEGGAGLGGVGGRGVGTGAGGDGGPGAGGRAGASGAGGGVSAGGTADIADSTLVRNVAGDGGAGGLGGGAMAGSGGVTNANGGRGGAGVGATGAAGGSGGAVAGVVTTTNSTVEANRAGTGGPGGRGFGGPGGGAHGEGDGGDGGLRVAGNGGGAGGGGGLTGGTLAHTTIARNAAGAPGAPGDLAGGSAGSGSPPGRIGAGFPGTAGTPAVSGGVVSATLANTILAHNEPQNCGALGTNADGNVDFPSSPCPGVTGDPRLGPLGDHGGPTPTRALEPGSSALGQGAPRHCAPTDQRGVARPQGGGCDAGAYELAPPAVATGDARAVTATSASLTGTVTPNARGTTYRFRFGRTDALGAETPAGDAGSGTGPTRVAATLRGLAPGTTYHYRLVAANADGTTLGARRTLTTAPAADRTRPALTAASLRPAVWSLRRGTAFRYTLSEAARVRFTIHRRGKRLVRAGSFAHPSPAGRTVKRFKGRIGRRSLKPGRYRATLVAVDAAGNRSHPRRLAFRIVRARAG